MNFVRKGYLTKTAHVSGPNIICSFLALATNLTKRVNPDFWAL